jgi:hypothetical protein
MGLFSYIKNLFAPSQKELPVTIAEEFIKPTEPVVEVKPEPVKEEKPKMKIVKKTKEAEVKPAKPRTKKKADKNG